MLLKDVLNILKTVPNYGLVRVKVKSPESDEEFFVENVVIKHYFNVTAEPMYEVVLEGSYGSE